MFRKHFYQLIGQRENEVDWKESILETKTANRALARTEAHSVPAILHDSLTINPQHGLIPGTTGPKFVHRTGSR